MGALPAGGERGAAAWRRRRRRGPGQEPKLQIQEIQSVLSCSKSDLSVLEGVVHWLMDGGMFHLKRNFKKQVCERLLQQFSLVLKQTDDAEVKSQLALCFLEAVTVFSRLLKHANDYLPHLTLDTAQLYVESKLRISWNKLNKTESAVLLRVVSLRQCAGRDNIVWKKQVAAKLARRAIAETAPKAKRTAGLDDGAAAGGVVNSATADDGSLVDNDEADESNDDESDATDDDSSEESDSDDDSDGKDDDSEAGDDKQDDEGEKDAGKDKEQKNKPYNKVSLVGNRRLLYRYLSHITTDKSTICDILIEVFRVSVEEVEGNSYYLPLSEEKKELWRLLAGMVKQLEGISQDDFPYKKIFQWLFSQFGIEMIQGSAADSPELIADLVTCLEKALEEVNIKLENVPEKADDESKETDGSEETHSDQLDTEELKSNKPKSTGKCRKVTKITNENEEDGCSADMESDEQPSESTEHSSSEWVVVMVDILLAVGTRQDAWWRSVLRPAGLCLSGRVNMDCTLTIIDVLMKEDMLMVDKDGDAAREEEDEDSDAQEEEAVNEDGDCEQIKDADKGSDYEDSEDEEKDSDESDSSDDNDDEEKGSDCEDDEDGSDDEMTAMKTKLMMAMGATSMGEGSDCEDMDAAPPEELSRLNDVMGQAFKEYLDRKKDRRRKGKNLFGEDMQLMQYRNRALDILSGVVEGSPLPRVQLTVLRTLIQAMELHKAKVMTELTNRIRDILKSVRSIKKFESIETVDFPTLQEHLEDVFSHAKNVPECCYAIVAILRQSIHLGKATNCANNPVIDSYLAHVTPLIGTRRYNKPILLEPLSIDIPELRTKLIQWIVDQDFQSQSIQEAAANSERDDMDTSCAPDNDAPITNGVISVINNVTADTNEGSIASNVNPISLAKISRHTAWQTMEQLFSKILASNVELNEAEKVSIAKVGDHVKGYLEECQVPRRRELTPVSLILKLLKRYPMTSECIDWPSISSSILQFRRRISPKLAGNKNLKRDVDRLATVALFSNEKYSAEAKEDKRGEKRKRKELREEKVRNKKMKLEARKEAEEALGTKKKKKNERKGMFGDSGLVFDDNDPEGDSDGGVDSEMEDELHDQKLKDLESQRLKKSKRSRAQRIKYKANKRIRKEATQERKRQFALEKEAAENSTSVVSTDANITTDAALDASMGESFNEDAEDTRQRKQPPKITRKMLKTVRNERDEILSSELRIGVFTKPVEL